MMMDDAATRELLGAYALDACDDEVAAVEALIAHDLDARHEADRLREVASWLAATEALAPSAGLRDALLSRARRVRPAPGDDPALALYVAQTDRFDALLDEIRPEQLDVETFNGLTVRELVVHMAAMESAFAASAGSPTIPEVIGTRTDVRGIGMVRIYPAHDRGGIPRGASPRSSLLVFGSDRLPHQPGDLDAFAAQRGDAPGVLGVQSNVEKWHVPFVMTACLYVKCRSEATAPCTVAAADARQPPRERANPRRRMP